MEAFPLTWPEGWKRTQYPARSKFKVTFGDARDELMAEIRRLGGSKVILSTNIPLRNDGLPYANWREPKDSGVAVYFQLKGKPMVFACDRWRTVAENAHAICLTVGAIRGIERWGASDMLERAFRGFQALPAGPSEQAPKTCWMVLGISPTRDLAEIRSARNAMARKFHPDMGESPDESKMIQVNTAFGEACTWAQSR